MQKKLWNKDFVLMLQGNAVSALGDILYSVAIGYWVYEKTGSSSLMGIMSSISMFMTMLVMPFSGNIVDKCDRKGIIVGMDAARGVIMLVLGVMAMADKLSVAMVLAAAFLASLCSVFFSPAVSTLMIDLIPHNDMVRGQSVSSGVNTAISLVGKALSGALVAALGVPLIILLNGVSYLISAFTELFITVPKTVNQGEKVTVKGVLKDFSGAVKLIFGDRFLRLFISCVLIVNLLASGPMTLMLPFVLNKGFTVDMYGYLMSVQTAATFVGVLLLGVVKLSPKVRYWVMTVGFCMFTVLSIAAYVSANFYPMAVLLFLSFFANMLGNGVFNASLMLALPEENRGGILGFVSSASTGGSALSAVIYGVLCDVFPITVVFLVGSIVSFLPMAYLCFHRDTKEFVLNH